jgi:GH15 family glucan-1,4-alpha-glucosidase
VDASLLLMGCKGYLLPEDPCLVETQDKIWQVLGRGPFLHRYPFGFDRMEEPEGAFLILSLWSVQNLAMRGDIAAARRLFEQVATAANDLGLFAEQVDPETGAALGNFPQAFSHTGLINAALAIERAERDAQQC